MTDNSTSSPEPPPIDEGDGYLGDAQDALNRMRRAFHRGTGCRLDAAMIRCLSLTSIGEMWEEPDPREDADA